MKTILAAAILIAFGLGFEIGTIQRDTIFEKGRAQALVKADDIGVVRLTQADVENKLGTQK